MLLVDSYLSTRKYIFGCLLRKIKDKMQEHFKVNLTHVYSIHRYCYEQPTVMQCLIVKLQTNFFEVEDGEHML